jgi:hypothetical protein
MNDQIDKFLTHGLTVLEASFDEFDHKDRIDAMKVVIALKKLQSGLESSKRGEFLKADISDEDEDDF